MKKSLVVGGFLIAVVLGSLYSFSRVPDKPSLLVQVEIVSLEDVPDQPGRRIITVTMPNGEEKAIETLTPFFYQPGYKATLGVFERTLFPDVFDFVSAAAG